MRSSLWRRTMSTPYASACASTRPTQRTQKDTSTVGIENVSLREPPICSPWSSALGAWLRGESVPSYRLCAVGARLPEFVANRSRLGLVEGVDLSPTRTSCCDPTRRISRRVRRIVSNPSTHRFYGFTCSSSRAATHSIHRSLPSMAFHASSAARGDGRRGSREPDVDSNDSRGRVLRLRRRLPRSRGR